MILMKINWKMTFYYKAYYKNKYGRLQNMCTIYYTIMELNHCITWKDTVVPNYSVMVVNIFRNQYIK